jgi:hypothetical protein
MRLTKNCEYKVNGMYGSKDKTTLWENKEAIYLIKDGEIIVEYTDETRSLEKNIYLYDCINEYYYSIMDWVTFLNITDLITN